ncbi:MAG TPA: hypothetical protein VFQ07_14000, partial [Candidatus Polarisedimenticolia bacterium]|nr:hypothetical protein [Candidatus Polarisedimenticolia bacterium]
MTRATMLRTLLSILLGGCLAGSAFAGLPDSPARVPPQTGHDVWGFKEGAPEPIVSLAQTADGYLWVASGNSLSRFDGVRFEPFQPPAGTQLVSTGLSALFALPSGGLWIGYRFGGFSLLKDGRLTHYVDDNNPTGTVSGFAQGPDGALWALTIKGLWRFDGARWERFGTFPTAPRGAMAFDRAGRLWLIVGKTLLSVRPGDQRLETLQDLSAVGFGEASGFTLDADGYAVTTTSWKPRTPPAGDAPPGYPLLKDGCDQRLDRNGGLWVFYRKLAHLMVDRPL